VHEVVHRVGEVHSTAKCCGCCGVLRRVGRQGRRRRHALRAATRCHIEPACVNTGVGWVPWRSSKHFFRMVVSKRGLLPGIAVACTRYRTQSSVAAILCMKVLHTHLRWLRELMNLRFRGRLLCCCCYVTCIVCAGLTTYYLCERQRVSIVRKGAPLSGFVRRSPMMHPFGRYLVAASSPQAAATRLPEWSWERSDEEEERNFLFFLSFFQPHPPLLSTRVTRRNVLLPPQQPSPKTPAANRGLSAGWGVPVLLIKRVDLIDHLLLLVVPAELVSVGCGDGVLHPPSYALLIQPPPQPQPQPQP